MASGTVTKYLPGSDSGWEDIPKSSSMSDTGTLRYRKFGDIVQVMASKVQVKNAITGTNVVLGTVPEGNRPMDIVAANIIIGSNYYNGYVTANGSISINKLNNSNIPSGTNIYFSCFYFLG